MSLKELRAKPERQISHTRAGLHQDGVVGGGGGDVHQLLDRAGVEELLPTSVVESKSCRGRIKVTRGSWCRT
jgi:hypothetical protein